MKHGTFSAGTTPEQVIRDAFTDTETGGFYWDLRGEDSRNADKMGLFSHNETTIDGFLAIIKILNDGIEGFDYADDESDEENDMWDWASGMRSGMLECIGIEEI